MDPRLTERPCGRLQRHDAQAPARRSTSTPEERARRTRSSNPGGGGHRRILRDDLLSFAAAQGVPLEKPEGSGPPPLVLVVERAAPDLARTIRRRRPNVRVLEAGAGASSVEGVLAEIDRHASK